MLDLFKCPYEAIDPMSPPYADVRVTTASSRIAIEVTEVHWESLLRPPRRAAAWLCLRVLRGALAGS
jgi:hypothetical protein